MQKYKVIEGSQSGHCCFDATIIDMEEPMIVGGKPVDGRFCEVCECLDIESANSICLILNLTHEELKNK